MSSCFLVKFEQASFSMGAGGNCYGDFGTGEAGRFQYQERSAGLLRRASFRMEFADLDSFGPAQSLQGRLPRFAEEGRLGGGFPGSRTRYWQRNPAESSHHLRDGTRTPAVMEVILYARISGRGGGGSLCGRPIFGSLFALRYE